MICRGMNTRNDSFLPAFFQRALGYRGHGKFESPSLRQTVKAPETQGPFSLKSRFSKQSAWVLQGGLWHQEKG